MMRRMRDITRTPVSVLGIPSLRLDGPGVSVTVTTDPVAAAQATMGGKAPAAPPMTMFCGVERFSQAV